MGTIIINLSDTTVSDSLIVKLSKAVEICQPCFKEAETNNVDWFIVATICGAIIIVAGIIAFALVYWQTKKMGHYTNSIEKETTLNNTIKDKEAELKETEKCNDFNHYKEKAIFDCWLESQKKNEMSDYEKIVKTYCDICSVGKNNSITIDEDLLKTIIDLYKKTNRESEPKQPEGSPK